MSGLPDRSPLLARRRLSDQPSEPSPVYAFDVTCAHRPEPMRLHSETYPVLNSIVKEWRCTTPQGSRVRVNLAQVVMVIEKGHAVRLEPADA
jgi:hypothetical protein